jgi:phosphoglycerol transferase MdoB-like AlkP superfamily enzyme
MTASDHGPYYIPEYFSPKSSNVKDKIVEYADWSLKKFVDLAKKEPWYKNTLFVFIADHGSPIDGTYEMPLSYNHTPLIFYNPNIIKTSKVSSSIAGQIDVFPTTMGLLNLSYTNNTLGIDLLKEERPYIFFNGDDKYGIIDKKWLLIVRDDNTSKLYKYQTKDTKDHSKGNPEIVDKMKNYAVSNLQTYQYMMLNGMQDYQ